ncbi:unnamed protein product [Chrysodeixis includens]|uniref:Uncharacterized protein n=1 Tax=Chrysodeixis includens TaxID=689277 RepID=A0A9N8KQN7_CHRIL|nr:unnamed protein product [Chrysodeixis includens]
MGEDNQLSWDEYYQTFNGKLELCLVDLLFNSGYGLIAGTVVSRYYLCNRRFPHMAGIALGVCITYFKSCKQFTYLLLLKMSEDDIIARIDDCMTHLVFKGGIGYIFGQLLVKYYLKGSRYPPIIGMAVGASHAWIRCRILDVYRPRAAAAEAKATAEVTEQKATAHESAK